MHRKPIELEKESDSSSSVEEKQFSLTNFQLILENDNDNNFSYSEETKVEVNVFDVASFILSKTGKTSTMKLQKLVYYCQAWSLVWDEQPIFPEKIKAWANGPVIGELFFQLKGLFQVDLNDLLIGNSQKLSSNQMETIEIVLDYYGDKSAQWLIELTHNEFPWQNARVGIPEGIRSNRIIELDSIAEYYSSL